MNPLCEQLTGAYRREHALYEQVLCLVDEQCSILAAAPDARAVLASCERVERVMAQIAAIEQAIGPAKAKWEQAREDPDGALKAVLGAIETLIPQIARAQERVQRGLLGYVEAQNRRTDSARSALNASRAHRLYRAG